MTREEAGRLADLRTRLEDECYFCSKPVERSDDFVEREYDHALLGNVVVPAHRTCADEENFDDVDLLRSVALWVLVGLVESVGIFVGF